MMKCLVTFLLTATVYCVNAQKTVLPSVTVPKFRKDTVNILAFGAKPDGNTLNTKAINNAIVALNKKGGGVVLIPGGLWLTGPIVLLSNINLSISTGATVLFTSDFDQYPLVEGNWEGL